MARFGRITNFLMYTMAIQVLAAFQLKITRIGDDIAKKQILPQTWVISGPSFAQIVFKISKFEGIS